MLRSLFAVGLVAVLVGAAVAEPPALAGPAPRVTVGQVAGDFLILEEAVAVTQIVAETRTVTENGVTKSYVVQKPVTVLKTTHEKVKLKEVKAYDLDGREVTPGRLQHILRERTAIAISNGGTKLDPLFRRMLKDDTLVLVLPPPVP